MEEKNIELAIISQIVKSNEIMKKTSDVCTGEAIKNATERLYKAFLDNTGASQGCADVLKAVHTGRGNIDWDRVMYSDIFLQEDVLLLLNASLRRLIKFDGILSQDQISKLFKSESGAEGEAEGGER